AIMHREVRVDDDKIHTRALHSLSGGKGADAGIHADDQPHSGSSGAFDDIVFHAIAVANAMRHVEIGGAAAEFDGGLQYDNRGRTIDIVIAVNQNVFFALDRG